jgi:hypothetical protein
VVLLCLAAAKAIWVSVPAWSGSYFDSYAAQEASRDRLWQTFRTSVVGWVLAGLVPLWSAGALLAIAPRFRRSTIALLSITTAAWLVYAVVPGEWMSAINYRRWVVPIAAPFALAAIVDERRVAQGETIAGSRNVALVMLAALFALVVGLQSLTFNHQLGRLRAEASAHGRTIVAAAELPCIRGTVLDHWSLTATFMFLQGKAPTQYLATTNADREALRSPSPEIPLHGKYPPQPGSGGWFDHRPMLARIRSGGD